MNSVFFTFRAYPTMRLPRVAFLFISARRRHGSLRLLSFFGLQMKLNLVLAIRADPFLHSYPFARDDNLPIGAFDMNETLTVREGGVLASPEAARFEGHRCTGNGSSTLFWEDPYRDRTFPI